MINMHILEISDKIAEYRRYLMEHTDDVKKAWMHMQTKPLIMQTLNHIPDVIELMEYRVSHHDLSKYSTEEFNVYRQYFYPCQHEKKDTVAFELAFKHHYECNDHHWQYWVNEDGTFKCVDTTTTKIGEPTKILAYTEMILDWTAMGYKFQSRALDYYIQNKYKIKIDPKCIDYIEILLQEMLI